MRTSSDRKQKQGGRQSTKQAALKWPLQQQQGLVHAQSERRNTHAHWCGKGVNIALKYANISANSWMDGAGITEKILRLSSMSDDFPWLRCSSHFHKHVLSHIIARSVILCVCVCVGVYIHLSFCCVVLFCCTLCQFDRFQTRCPQNITQT